MLITLICKLNKWRQDFYVHTGSLNMSVKFDLKFQAIAEKIAINGKILGDSSY